MFRFPNFHLFKVKILTSVATIALTSCSEEGKETLTATNASQPTFATSIAATELLSGHLSGTTWSGQGIQSNNSTWSIRVDFHNAGRATAYYDSLGCRANWTVAESKPQYAIYREEVVSGSRCIDTFVRISELADEQLSYTVSIRQNGSTIARSVLEPGYLNNQRVVAPELPTSASVVAIPQTPQRSCGAKPTRPSVPSRPASLSCSSSAIQKRVDNCAITGAAEVACSEILEGSDTRISTGAINGALCSSGGAFVQGNDPDFAGIFGSAMIGALDNVGEEIGGPLGFAIRIAAGGGKLAAIGICQDSVRAQCNPELVLRPYREKLAEYERCMAG